MKFLTQLFGVLTSVIALMFGMNVANAALPAAAATAFTGLQTDALDLVDLAWTAIIPITVAFIILRLFKRAASSAV
jgi:hypothetical protein